MKQCRKCGVTLVVGENWGQSKADARDYLCRAFRDNPAFLHNAIDYLEV